MFVSGESVRNMELPVQVERTDPYPIYIYNIDTCVCGGDRDMPTYTYLLACAYCTTTALGSISSVPVLHVRASGDGELYGDGKNLRHLQ